jgi:hypothetical protein
MIKQHPIYSDYYISSDGRVFSSRQFKDKSRRKELKHFKNRKGYWWIRISTDEGRKTRAVYHLVLETFDRFALVGEEARHLDGDNQNNSIANLAWGTSLDNSIDRYKHREKTGKGITNKQAIQIINRYTPNCPRDGMNTIAREYGVSRQTVSSLVHGKTFKHLTRAPEHDIEVK